MKEMYSHEMPWWMRAIGIWRVNRDSFDFKWGYFAPRPGLELLIHRGFYFDPTCRISFCFGWGQFHIKLPFKTKLEEACDWPSYGFQVVGTQFWIRTGDCERNQRTRKLISWDLPFVSLVFDGHEVATEAGEWVPHVGSWENSKGPDGRYVESHSYRYTLKSGEIQERTATIYKERRRYHYKWLPFWTKTFTAISVKFNGEVGERAGSWKGGVVGCGWDMLPGETMLQTLRRMEAERVFS